jgi:uncharacterized protein (DUF362 family)
LAFLLPAWIGWGQSAELTAIHIKVVSEYGLEPAVGHIHINRVLREQGYVAVRETLGWEMLDFGASRAFAVADHQVAHVYVNQPADLPLVAELLSRTPGI